MNCDSKVANEETLFCSTCKRIDKNRGTMEDYRTRGATRVTRLGDHGNSLDNMARLLEDKPDGGERE